MHEESDEYTNGTQRRPTTETRAIPGKRPLFGKASLNVGLVLTASIGLLTLGRTMAQDAKAEGAKKAEEVKAALERHEEEEAAKIQEVKDQLKAFDQKQDRNFTVIMEFLLHRDPQVLRKALADGGE
jgi:hypothetical protein